MYRSILVGTDGSATAIEAVKRAAGLAAQNGAVLHIVCAYQDSSYITAMAPGVGGSTSIDSALRDAAEEIVAKAGADCATDGLSVETHTFQGEASDVVIEAAETLGCDLIVVGNRGMRGGKRMILGSVPNRVAHHAVCDVLIIHTT